LHAKESEKRRQKVMNLQIGLQTGHTLIHDIENEKITSIPVSKIIPFKNHPFKVNDDSAMQELVDSIKDYGVMVPLIVRQTADGNYELMSGHRRRRVCEVLGIEMVPARVVDIDDDSAAILVVDSNLQREHILPSERAFALKLKLEAMKHQGKRTDSTSSQLGTKLGSGRSDEEIAGQTGESRSQIQRYIRLTELVPELLALVDRNLIGMNPAVELSYLTKEEQRMLLSEIEKNQATPSLSQAQRLKKLSQKKALTAKAMAAVMMEEKKDTEKITLSGRSIDKYFPRTYTPEQKQETIIRLLEQWWKSRGDSNKRS
jgi:ParB family chromosome partitioning protein